MAGPFGNMAGPFGNMAGPFGNLAGPFGNVAGPFGNMAGPFGNMAGPFPSVEKNLKQHNLQRSRREHIISCSMIKKKKLTRNTASENKKRVDGGSSNVNAFTRMRTQIMKPVSYRSLSSQ
jgi:hypothetical protein